MTENINFYPYLCLGKRIAIVDFLHRGVRVPEKYSPLCLGVSHDADAVLEKAPDLPELLCLGHFMLNVRGLPLDELDVAFCGSVEALRFFNTGADMIGVGCSKCKSDFTKKLCAARYGEGVSRLRHDGVLCFFAEVKRQML